MAAVFEERADPGLASSALLAAAVHALLFLVLLFGVNWQNRPPEAVIVEIVEEPAPAVVQIEPKPAPAPVVVKPEPVIAKPEIAEKAPPPKPKPVPKVEPNPVPKHEAVRPKVDEAQKRMREELAREQSSFAIERERAQLKDQLARDASAANSQALATWIDKVRAKIRGHIVLPPDLKGNPEAIFDVVQLPTGEVLSVRLRKSSGHPGYDVAVERAILKSSPLPRPDRAELFQRGLELKFRPLD